MAKLRKNLKLQMRKFIAYLQYRSHTSVASLFQEYKTIGVSVATTRLAFEICHHLSIKAGPKKR